MACPFPPALPQHKKQCWHNRGPKSHRPAGLAQLMRPRWRLPMGNAWRVSKAALAFQHEPRMHQEAPGSLRRPQEASGGPRRLQEAPWGPRKPKEAPGGPRKPQEVPGGFRKPKEVQEAPGNPRRPQEDPRGPGEAPGCSRRPWEAPGGPRRSTNRRANVRRASAGAQLSEKLRAAPKRERHFALSRAMCAASHSCHEFRKADDKKVHAEKKHVDFVLVFDR